MGLSTYSTIHTQDKFRSVKDSIVEDWNENGLKGYLTNTVYILIAAAIAQEYTHSSKWTALGFGIWMRGLFYFLQNHNNVVFANKKYNSYATDLSTINGWKGLGLMVFGSGCMWHGAQSPEKLCGALVTSAILVEIGRAATTDTAFNPYLILSAMSFSAAGVGLYTFAPFQELRNELHSLKSLVINKFR